MIKTHLMNTKFFSYIFIAILSFTFFTCEEDEVLPPQSQAEFTASATQVAVGEEIQFTNNSENATAYAWSFGDGTTSNQVSPRKTYATSNVFLVSLVSTGSGGSTISNLEVTVTPASSFSVENEEDLIATIPVQFVNTSAGANTYSWEFGDADNSTSTEESPMFTYATAGTFTVSLTASSAFGSQTFTKDVIIGEAPEAPANLYYMAIGDEYVRKLILDGTGAVSDVYNAVGKGGVGMAYDDVNEKLYFSDFDTYPFGNIWRMNLDGTGIEAIATNIGDPYAIALDVDGNKVYWVDDDGNVSKANLDGSNPEIGFFSVPGVNWRAISLDVENGKMYVYDVNIEEVYEVNLDGTNPNVIITGNYGYALLVDTVNDKIYFDDQNDDLLKVANLDGTNIQTIDAEGTRIYGMQIDHEAGKLYWSGRDSGELYSANLDGTDRQVLRTGIASPRGIALIK
ncbi:PKD domain-containing protein [Psychroserpens burtonensis]|uniref:PKD domain-containing protein n=2 Tax=Psychroserpens burtonensis TaxID=49278 RepID=A0A5C7BBR5_9FLAO|nr:PKD domain-containing protein [Psychroserpens burtonensis]